MNRSGRRHRSDDNARLQCRQFQREPRQPIEDTIGKAQRERIIDVLSETCLPHALA